MIAELIIDGNRKRLPRHASFDGNPKIKKSFVKIKYTQEQIEELAKCSSDILYFAEKYIFIIDPDKGLTKIILREYQKKYLLQLQDNRFNVVMMPRQSGKSLLSAIFILWFSIFNSSKKSAILANKERIAREIFDKVKLAYEYLPFWIQPGVAEWNALSMKLENNSSISCGATSASAIRGLTISGLLFLDEFAFLPRNIAEDFISSVYPTIVASKESKIVIVSTPNGLNNFYEIWRKAEQNKNSFKPFKIKWNEVPGRDEKWLEKTKKDIGEIKTNTEFLCHFVGSSKTLIRGLHLENLIGESPIRIKDAEIKIYQEPLKNHRYVLGVDSAKGIGGDYSAIQVLDLSIEPICQVAVYSNSNISPTNFAKLVVELATYYNEAFLMIENNDIGYSVTNTIWNELEYTNLIHVDTIKNDLGIRATKKSKSKALEIMKDYIENKLINIIDSETIYQLSRFIETSQGVFRAEEGEHDDLVSALYWALYITYLKDYYDKENILVTTSEEKENDDDPMGAYFPEESEDNEENSFKRDLLL